MSSDNQDLFLTELNVSTQAAAAHNSANATMVIDLTQPVQPAPGASPSDGIFAIVYSNTTLLQPHLNLMTDFVAGRTSAADALLKQIRYLWRSNPATWSAAAN